MAVSQVSTKLRNLQSQKRANMGLTCLREAEPLQVFLDSKAESTRMAYSAIWRDWVEYLKSLWRPNGDKDLIEATQAEALRFLEIQAKRKGQRPRFGRNHKVSPATVARKSVILYAIYTFLRDENLVHENPFRGMIYRLGRYKAGLDKRPTKIVPWTEVHNILELPSEKTREGKRDKTFMALLFGGGLRINEALGLTIADVQQTPKGTWFVFLEHTKAQKPAKQALPDWAGVATDDLARSRAAEGARRFHPLLTNYRGPEMRATNKPMNEHTARRLFKRYCAEIGLSDVSPHSARVTAITKLRDDGVSARDVQQFSRHKSIQMVEHYYKRMLELDENPAKKLSY